MSRPVTFGAAPGGYRSVEMTCRVTALLVALAALGCANDDLSAPPMAFRSDGGDRHPEFGLTGEIGGTAGGTQPPFPQQDGGVVLDGGSFRVPLCIALDPLDPTNFVNLTRAGTPLDFTPRAAFARIVTNQLGDPVLLVSLTEGACEVGIGQQLTFEVDGAAIGQQVVAGDNVVVTEPSPLRVRFRDLSEPEVPEIFGTCSDASGTIAFGSLAAEENALIKATFPGIRLGSCLERTLDPVVADGAFSVPLAAF